VKGIVDQLELDDLTVGDGDDARAGHDLPRVGGARGRSGTAGDAERRGGDEGEFARRVCHGGCARRRTRKQRVANQCDCDAQRFNCGSQPNRMNRCRLFGVTRGR